jgi:hypothetical protein
MKYYIFGIRGNMARRYIACLRYLGHEIDGHDKGDAFTLGKLKDASGVIICSPSDEHLTHIKQAIPSQLPILCEKPITRNFDELQTFEKNQHLNLSQLQMVNQYSFLEAGSRGGLTEYDYFKSGADGLLWDCINIVGLARGKVRLANNSPVWDCAINGKQLSLADMDVAYLKMISSWVKNPVSNWSYTEMAHRKVNLWLKFLSESKHGREVSDFLESPWS